MFALFALCHILVQPFLILFIHNVAWRNAAKSDVFLQTFISHRLEVAFLIEPEQIFPRMPSDVLARACVVSSADNPQGLSFGSVMNHTRLKSWGKFGTSKSRTSKHVSVTIDATMCNSAPIYRILEVSKSISAAHQTIEFWCWSATKVVAESLINVGLPKVFMHQRGVSMHQNGVSMYLKRCPPIRTLKEILSRRDRKSRRDHPSLRTAYNDYKP